MTNPNVSEPSTLPSPESTMKPPSPTRATELLTALTSTLTRISTVTASHQISKPIRLVAVSKLKPLTDIIALVAQNPSNPNHNPQTHFGENYVQELVEKSHLLPPALHGKVYWHFIGGLQSNKAQTLAREVRGLWAVESVDSVKKAKLLDKGRGERKTAAAEVAAVENTQRGNEGERGAPEEGPLRVFVQVNTSGESSKSGLEPRSPQLLELCRHIRDQCPHLHLQGLMTIGAIARSQATTAETENEDFACLRETRDWVAVELGIEGQELELSMGMSGDFEAAIRMGSDEVRVGSTIFGERPPKGEATVVSGGAGEEQRG